MLESLVRLSQAHAKLLCHREVQTVDAIMSILLMESSFQSQSVCNLKLDVFQPFSPNPDVDMQEKSEIILAKLGLNSLISSSA